MDLNINTKYIVVIIYLPELQRNSINTTTIYLLILDFLFIIIKITLI